VLTQTRRHSYICSLLGIKHVAVAVNKIDLVDFSAERFHHIMGDYFGFAQQLGFASITPIPLSARYGENVTGRSEKMRWYDGPTLLEFLEGVEVEQALAQKPFRFPVQWVNRPNLDFRGFSGTVASGTINPGDKIVVAAQLGHESADPSREILRGAVAARVEEPDRVRRAVAREREDPEQCEGEQHHADQLAQPP
jgi:bifunctional enzyme CysN/CysC